MALSNIWREPRRELTESVVGVGVMGAFFYGDYWLAVWLNSQDPKHAGILCWMLVGAGILALAVLIAGSLILFTHFIGEEICNSLAKRGIELRPQRRY